VTKPFMFTGLGLFLITAWTFISQINFGAVMGCVAGYSIVDMLFR
jgi:hypothetical protein